MEIAAGGELYDYLSERKKLEENEARRIFRQIATAVFYCHKVSGAQLKKAFIKQKERKKRKKIFFVNFYDVAHDLQHFCLNSGISQYGWKIWKTMKSLMNVEKKDN